MLPIVPSVARFRRFGAVARALLLLTAMSFTIASCVLPPPPTPEPVVVPELHLDYQKLTPVGAGPFLLQRDFNSLGLAFSVKNAISASAELQVNTYWFIAFKLEEPTAWDVEGELITLHPCDFKLRSKDVVTVEALVTTGELVIDAEQTDPRVTVNGEPIIRAVWTVQIDGPDANCQKGSE